MKTILASIVLALIPLAASAASWYDIRFSCSPQCPAPVSSLQVMKWRMVHQLERLENNIGVKIPESYKPLEVHPYYDNVCQNVIQVYKVAPGTAGFNHLLKGGTAMICLNTSVENLLEGRSAFIHELSHLYLRIRRSAGEKNLYEEPLALLIASCHSKCGENVKELAKRLVEHKLKGPLTNAIVEKEIRELKITLPHL